ncbi:hypothetical protein BDF14DRAFT_1769704 [Spinellus fusiger]|nr:hypothetical protein BDF14DRAFT_1769704 [Spinellus fusiger]
MSDRNPWLGGEESTSQHRTPLSPHHDPYRKRKAVPDEDEAAHSRTASDSSTSRLATNTSMRIDYEDPYCPHRPPDKSKRLLDTQRTNNAYLPYSYHTHHTRRDPSDLPASLYLEDPLPLFPVPDKQGVVSMLQIDGMTDSNPTAPSPPLFMGPELLLGHGDTSTQNKRKKKRKGRQRAIALVCFLCILAGIIGFFVWPRFPTLQLAGSDVISKTEWTTNTTRSMKTAWQLNFTADNTENWIYTHLSNIAVTITDLHSLEQFGQGMSGPLVLASRKYQPISIVMDIFYSTTSQDDRTFQDLYNACGVQVKNPVPAGQQEALQVIFHITYSIVGIAWTKTGTLQPKNGFVCPTD